MKWLSQCSKAETLALSAILALAQQLDGDLTDYVLALTELNRKYYGEALRFAGSVGGLKKGSSLNPAKGSLSVQRSAPHARKRYGQ